MRKPRRRCAGARRIVDLGAAGEAQDHVYQCGLRRRSTRREIVLLTSNPASGPIMDHGNTRTRNVVTVRKGHELTLAAQLMRRNPVGYLLAVALEERELLEQASASNEARFRAVFTHNLIPTVIWESDGRISDANESFFSLTGYGRADMESGSVRTGSLIAAASSAGLPEASRSEAGGVLPSVAGERMLVRRDESRIPVLVGGYRFPGRSAAGFASFLDLSALRRADAERFRAEHLHTAVMASLNDRILVLNRSGVVIDANAAWCRLAEQPQCPQYERARVGDSYLLACRNAARSGDGVAADLFERVHEALGGSSAGRRLEYSRKTPEGMLWHEICVAPLRLTEGGALIVCTDITARRRGGNRAQDRREPFAMLGRGAELGELSGAFAHELAQPLTAILGNAEAALQICSGRAGQTELEEILRDIVNDSLRAAKTIQRLRSMLLYREITRQSVDLNQIVRDVLALVHRDLMGRHVTVSLELEPSIARALTDPVQLQQVLLNLITNACESMSGNPPGSRHLDITTRTTDGGRAVECAVSDGGNGIAAKDLERVFTPFFTTKQHGLGLGLAISRSIVEAHGGRLWAEQRPGGGAVFRFTAVTGT